MFEQKLNIDLNTAIILINSIIILLFFFKSYTVYIVKREAVRVRWAFISFFLIVIISCISNLLVYQFNLYQLVFLQFSMTFTGFLYGPIIYYYSLSIVNYPIEKHLKYNFYIAPIIFFAGLSYLFLDSATQMNYLAEMKKGEHVPVVILNYLDLFNAIFYCVLALKKLNSERKIKSFADDSFYLKHKWAVSFVKYMIFNLLLFVVISITIGVVFPKYQLLSELLIYPIFMYVIYTYLDLKNDLMAREVELNYLVFKLKHQNALYEQRVEISRDLHDNIGSQLTFIISSIDILKFGLQKSSGIFEKKLSQISDFTSNTIVELRDTVWALNNNDIVFEDLKIRILNFINQAKVAKETIDFQFFVDEKLRNEKLSSFEWVNIYRTIQEVINNVIKHSEASKLNINVVENENKIAILICDNGKGFQRGELLHENGLLNIEKRIQNIGGKIVVDSILNQGTTIKIHI